MGPRQSFSCSSHQFAAASGMRHSRQKQYPCNNARRQNIDVFRCIATTPKLAHWRYCKTAEVGHLSSFRFLSRQLARTLNWMKALALSYQIQLQNAILKSICDFFHSFQGVFQELCKSDDTCGARAWNIIPYNAKAWYAATHAP